MQPSFPKWAGVAALLGGAILLGILGVLVAVLLSLEGTRSEIVVTREGVTDTEQRVDRLTASLVPVLEAVAPAAKDTRRGLRRAQARITPLLDEARTGIGVVTGAAGEVLAGDPASLIATARNTLVALPAAADTAVAITDRFRRQLHRLRRQFRRSIRVQRGTRTLNGETVALLRESLAIQREILVHTRSLDTKTGGPVEP